MSVSPIRIVLVDDLSCFREVLSALLSNVPGLVIVGVGKNGLEALQLVEALKPDVLIIDHVMPCLSGLAVSKIVRTRYPATRTILLTMDELAAAEADQESHGRGLIKGCSLKEIIDAVFENTGMLEHQDAAIVA